MSTSKQTSKQSSTCHTEEISHHDLTVRLIKILKLNEIFLTLAPVPEKTIELQTETILEAFFYDTWLSLISLFLFAKVGGGGEFYELGFKKKNYPNRFLVWKTQTFGLGLSLLGLEQPRHLFHGSFLNIQVCILQSYTIAFFHFSVVITYVHQNATMRNVACTTVTEIN